ncbi:MAG: sigma-70 family RNA polymerase sigma factor [Anaerolineales bacterium]|nr:sigma-70 family RNA polymerase sigma factor [Anaerolineales bacterium]
MTMNLDALLERKQATPEEVVTYLVTHFYAPIHHLALSILQDKLAADDVAQEALLKAANRIHQYEPHSNLQAWVYRIGLNEARAQLRKQKARQRMQRWFKQEVGMDTAVPTPEALTIQNERDRKLWQAINQLPDRHRLPIILRYSHNLATAEIAEILQIPPGTVRSRLHYAHQRLHQLLETIG